MSKCLTTEEFIKRSTLIHNNKYDYSKVIYINIFAKIKIICPVHGEFLQTPNDHLQGKGCSKCSPEREALKKLYTTELFIQKAKNIYENKYEYSKSNYINAKTKLIVTCLKHGDFLVTPNNHLRGEGCPLCNSSKGELLIAKILDNLNISYERQKRFKDCINPITNHKLPYDFYLPQENMLIEYNGEQHYKHKNYWHKTNTLKDQQFRDNLKQQYAIDNGYTILVIKFNEDIEKILKTNIHPF